MEPSHEPLPYATRLRRLTASEYMHMVDAGVFGERERLELIEGVLCRISPRSVLHARIIQMLSGRPRVGPGRGQPPGGSAKGLASSERGAHHRSEVARNSLREDRSTKGALYARHGVAEFWLVDVERQRVEVYRSPDTDSAAYAERTTAQAGDVLTSQAVPGLRVPLDSVW